MGELHFQSACELAARMRRGELSPVDLTDRLLERIEHLDSELGAFLRVCPERARAEARAAAAVLEGGGEVGPLHGIPYAAKDLFDVVGLPTTAGSSQLEDNLPPRESTVTRLLSRSGMVLVGKTHTVQFAYGGVGINHDHGTPHNPWASRPCVPGGSSSGSGVAVAAGLVPVALGTDTGGSVRIPAALCGIVGLKTTVGQVSRAGVFPLSFSLDSVGVLSRSVEDAAHVYEAMRGEDPRDPSTRGMASQDVLGSLARGVKGLRLAFAESMFWRDLDPEIAGAVRAAGEVFSCLGARVEEIPFEEAREAQALNPRGLVIAAEAYAIHHRRLEGQAPDFDPVVQHRIEAGRDIPAWEYVEITRAWEELRRKTLDRLQDVDGLLVPTTLIPSRRVDEVDATLESYTEANLLYLRNTSIGNILNLCGLSVPCGFTSQGMPIGLMIYARPFGEDMALRIGRAFEEATEWHRRAPDLGWIS